MSEVTKHETIIEALEWVFADRDFKAPEEHKQPEIISRWVHRVRDAVLVESGYARPGVLQPPPLTPDELRMIDHEVLPRVMVERRVVWNLLHHLEAKGWLAVAVNLDETVKVRTPAEAMAEIFSVDDCWVQLTKEGQRHAVRIVLGNDGTDCICDWGHYFNDSDGFNAAMETFDPETCV